MLKHKFFNCKVISTIWFSWLIPVYCGFPGYPSFVYDVALTCLVMWIYMIFVCFSYSNCRCKMCLIFTLATIAVRLKKTLKILLGKIHFYDYFREHLGLKECDIRLLIDIKYLRLTFFIEVKIVYQSFWGVYNICFNIGIKTFI